MVFKTIIFQSRLVDSRPPPPFMEKSILNFHFDYLHPSLSSRTQYCPEVQFVSVFVFVFVCILCLYLYLCVDVGAGPGQCWKVLRVRPCSLAANNLFNHPPAICIQTFPNHEEIFLIDPLPFAFRPFQNFSCWQTTCYCSITFCIEIIP